MEQPPIADIIQHYGGTYKKGYNSWQKLRCPFHADSHASAGMSMQDNIFVCHGCGIKGNPFNIIKEYEGVKYGEAIKIAERITGQVYNTLRKKPSLGRRVSSQTRNRHGNSSTGSIRSRR